MARKLKETSTIEVEIHTHTQDLSLSIRGFVHLLVHLSVRQAFLKYRGNEELKTKHQGTHRITFFKKIQQFIGRIVVRIELVLL